MRQNFNEGSQLPSRKTKMVIEQPPVKKSRLPYILLGITALLVLYFGYNMLASNEETLVSDDTKNSEQITEENTKGQDTPDSSTTPETNTNDQGDNTTTSNPDQPVSNEGEGSGTDSEATPSNTTSSPGSNGNGDSVGEGFEEVIGENLWEPIGTTQQEPHVMSFELDSTDWNEMVAAVLYATKIPEDKLIIWRLQNGGAPDLAIGTVSTYEYRNSPFQVHLKWVTNEGWMPTKVFQLEHNSYFNE